MTRARYFVFVLTLTAPLFLTVVAQDQPATSRKPSSSPAVPVPDGGVATAAPSEFNLGRGREHRLKNTIPRSERWQVHWTPADLQDYTRQLDFFTIELAVAGGGKPKLKFLSNISKPNPDSREGTGLTEKRLCMTWNGRGGKLVDFDKEILAQAGVSATDRVLLQYYPAALENMLAFLERENAMREGHKHIEEYRMTTFGVRPTGKVYEIYVEKQEFRQAPH